MLPRFRSFYGKIIVFTLVAISFLLYVKVLQVNENGNGDAAALVGSNTLHQRQQHPRQQMQQQLQQQRQQQAQAQLQQPVAEAPRRSSSVAIDLRENEIAQQSPPQSSSTAGTLNAAEASPYELSVRLDLAKQEPGLGNEGKAVFLHGAAKERGDRIYKKIALNEELSERLAYNRTVPDARHPQCRNEQFELATLPSTSVIIIFYNEPYSVLVRTVHSTLSTCNERLLKEIILVDDGSTNLELGNKLDYYISTRIPGGKVQVLRLKNRLGLIRARLAGARIATGDVLIFLDAHCEANIGWCEPLMQRIKESRTSVLVPIIDVIDSKDFQYSTNGYKSFQVGGFEWSGHFNWINVPTREVQRQKRECQQMREICPAYSPTMAGGLFAIDRKYFWEIGSYDEQMDGWGGENLEMSFRIWQCGGTIETIPCSRVGHVFRDFHPYKFPNNRDTHGINTARMALAWMDDYINIFYINRPDLKYNPDIGDVTHRVMLRKKLRCKSFDWYLKHVYPEKFVPNKDVAAWGRVKAFNTRLCLDDLLRNNEQPYNLGVFTCGKTLSKSQFFSFTHNGVLRNELSCATVQVGESFPRLVVMTPCMENDKYNEKWKYENEQLQHILSGLCLDARGLKGTDEAQVRVCDPRSETQRWIMEHEGVPEA